MTALPLSEVASKLHYADKVTVSVNTGAKSVYASTVKGGGLNDKLRFMMVPHAIDPCSDADVATLPTSPFGLSEPMQGASGSKLSLEVVVDAESEAFVKGLDAQNIEAAGAYSEEWFKKKIESSIVEDMYSPIVKKATDPAKYKDTVRVKVVTEGERATKIYFAKKSSEGELDYSEGSYKDILGTSGRDCKFLINVETNGLWFMQRQFGMTLNATEIIVWTSGRKRGIEAFCFAGAVKKNRVKEEEEDPPAGGEHLL